MTQQTENARIDNLVAQNILKNISIPPCPTVVLALMEEARQPEVNFSKMVKLISGDVGLTASMLKTANSPFFAVRTKVNSVQQAVTLLGLKNLMQIVRSSALQNAIKGDQIEMAQFWDHSNLTAAVASRMAKHLAGVSRDDAYTYAIFHDCGIPILMQKFSDYKQKVSASINSSTPIITAEEQSYATNHALVGNMLTRNWCLPDHICQAIKVHHDRFIFTKPGENTTPVVCTLVAIQLISEFIVANFLNKPAELDWQLRGQDALNYLSLTNDEIEDITEDSLAELEEVRAYQ